MKPARTETFSHTITGLLRKRARLFNEDVPTNKRYAEALGDIGAIDRVLRLLGYSGDPDAVMPRQKRRVMFSRGELGRAIYQCLRSAEAAMTSRDIARAIAALCGGRLSEITYRVSKALGKMRKAGTVRGVTGAKGNVLWALRQS